MCCSPAGFDSCKIYKRRRINTDRFSPSQDGTIHLIAPGWSSTKRASRNITRNDADALLVIARHLCRGVADKPAVQGVGRGRGGNEEENYSRIRKTPFYARTRLFTTCALRDRCVQLGPNPSGRPSLPEDR